MKKFNDPNYTDQEHKENLERLGITSYDKLDNKEVWYVKPSYGIHTVVGWDCLTNTYLLDCGGSLFRGNPFSVFVAPIFRNNQLQNDLSILLGCDDWCYTDITTDYVSDLGFILDIKDSSYFYAKEEDRDFDNKLIMDLLEDKF